MVDAAVRAEYIELSHAADRIEYRRAQLLAAIHRRGIPYENGASSTPAWVQYNTGQHAGEARASLNAGLALETLPLTAKAWAQGEISASAARAICEGRPDGYEDDYAILEELLVRYAADRNWRGLRAVDRTLQAMRGCARRARTLRPQRRPAVKDRRPVGAPRRSRRPHRRDPRHRARAPRSANPPTTTPARRRNGAPMRWIRSSDSSSTTATSPSKAAKRRT